MKESWPAAGPSVAPFALLRIAALPLGVLDAVAPPEIAAAIDAAVTAAETMESLRVDLEGALHDMVPLLGRACRGDAITLRRNIHNGLLPTKGAWWGEGLNETTRQKLNSWQQAAIHHRDGLARAEQLVTQEGQGGCRARLQDVAQTKQFRHAVALASPDLLDAIDRRWSPRTERALLTYLMRAAAKTSPFGAFMRHHVVALDGQAALRFGEIVTRRGDDRGLVSSLHRAALGCCGDAAHARLRRNQTLHFDGVHATGLVTELQWLVGRAWRAERYARFRMLPPVWRALGQLSDSFSLTDLWSALKGEGVGTAQICSVAERLLQAGVVEVSPLCDAHEERPLQVYLRTLEGCASESASVLRLALTETSENPAAFGRAWSAVSPAPPPRLQIVPEDAVVTAGGSMSAEVAALVHELACQLRPRLRYRVETARLIANFVERFGHGGRCDSVLKFFVDVFPAVVGQPWEQPAPANVPRHVRIPMSALVQVADSRLVINRVYSGAAWLAGRYATRDDPPGVLRALLENWLAHVAAPYEPVCFVFSGDCNPLQAVPRLTARTIRWPGEAAREPCIDLASLAIVHEHASNSLLLVDGDGRRIIPFYLGGTFPTAASGPKFLLTTLASPFIFVPPSSFPPPGEDVRHVPAVEHRNIVWQREMWWMSTDRLRALWLAERGARRLYHTARDRRALGMPPVVYAQPYAKQPRRNAVTSKPLWVDTRSSLSLDLLERLCVGADAVSLAVALPDRVSASIKIDGRAHTSELMVEFVV